MTDQIIEARVLAEALKKVFASGPPSCWPASARLIAESALRLAELSAELLPVMEGAIAEGVEATIRAHEQLNGMQANLERIGASSN